MTDEKSPNVATGVASSVAQDNAPVPAANPSFTGPPAKPPSPEQQWHLALTHLAIGNGAANMLRALLFVAALVLLVFVFATLPSDPKGPSLWAHGLVIVFCVLALVSIVKSFHLQSEQSMQRFRLLRIGNLEALAQHDSVVEQLRGRQSAFWDRIAAWSVMIAAVIEVLARLMAETAIINV